MTECPSFDQIAAGEADPAHLGACPACADAERDVTAIRAEARQLGPAIWTHPAPGVDVDAALARVLNQARAPRSRPRQILRLVSRAAAAVLVAGLGAPYVLEARKTPEPAPRSQQQRQVSAVFWTTPLALSTRPGQ